MAQFASASKKGPAGLVVLCVLLFLGYFLIFPRHLGPEYYISPRSAEDMTAVKGEPKTGAGFLFELGGLISYSDPQGKLQFLLPEGLQMSLGAEKYAQLNSETKDLEVWKPGQKLFALPGYSYPYWSGDHLYTFDPNLFGVGEISGGGQVLWYRSYASIITAVDGGKGLTVIGLVTGQVEIVDNQGKVKGQYFPVASKHLVVYNAKIAPDDSKVGILCGADPKRFVLLDRGPSGEFQPVVSRELTDDTTVPTPLGFLAGGRFVYFYNGKGLTLMDTKSHEEKYLSFSGTLEWVDFNQVSGLLTLITKDQGKTALGIYTQDGGVVTKAQFLSQDFFIRHDKKNLFLGIDKSFLKLEEQIQ